MKRPNTAVACLVLLALTTLPLACSDLGIVGGGTCDDEHVAHEGRCLDECPEDLSACNGACTDLSDDEQHCGECGNVCGSGSTCFQGACVEEPGDAGAEGDASMDGAAGDAGDANADGAAGDAGDADMDGAASDAGSDGAAGDGATEAGPDAGCSPPLQACNGICTDVSTDPENCGDCDVVCSSGICQSRTCQGATPGHIVLACMNYRETSLDSPPQVILGNAVFLPLAKSVRVLAYDQFAPAAVATSVDGVIQQAGIQRGRDYRLIRESDSARIPARLRRSAFEVFVIYSQSNATDVQLTSIGAGWASTLDTFVKSGGVVVVLSGGEGSMGSFITASNLMNVSAETSVTGQTVYNQFPADAIGVNVVTPFAARADSCAFTTNLASTPLDLFVITNAAGAGAGAPVVVHRVVLAP